LDVSNFRREIAVPLSDWRAFGYWIPHPVVDELRSAALKAGASAGR
jgi:hypothetical protein